MGGRDCAYPREEGVCKLGAGRASRGLEREDLIKMKFLQSAALTGYLFLGKIVAFAVGYTHARISCQQILKAERVPPKSKRDRLWGIVTAYFFVNFFFLSTLFSFSLGGSFALNLLDMVCLIFAHRSNVIGLTGGIACGKSTVAKLLRENGAVLIDADLISHEVLESKAVRAKLLHLFGS